jgi:hypothetical protein
MTAMLVLLVMGNKKVYGDVAFTGMAFYQFNEN